MLICPNISSKIEGVITKVCVTHLNISINKSDDQPTVISFKGIYQPEDYLTENLLNRKVGESIKGKVLSFGEGKGLILEILH